MNLPARYFISTSAKKLPPIFMSTFLACALIIGLPIAASRGALYRGAWAGITVISFLLGLGMGMTPAPPDTPGSTITTAEVKQWLFDGLMFIAFASLLAVCFYRKAKAVKTEE